MDISSISFTLCHTGMLHRDCIRFLPSRTHHCCLGPCWDQTIPYTGGEEAKNCGWIRIRIRCFPISSQSNLKEIVALTGLHCFLQLTSQALKRWNAGSLDSQSVIPLMNAFVQLLATQVSRLFACPVSAMELSHHALLRMRRFSHQTTNCCSVGVLHKHIIVAFIQAINTKLHYISFTLQTISTTLYLKQLYLPLRTDCIVWTNIRNGNICTKSKLPTSM